MIFRTVPYHHSKESNIVGFTAEPYKFTHLLYQFPNRMGRSMDCTHPVTAIIKLEFLLAEKTRCLGGCDYGRDQIQEWQKLLTHTHSPFHRLFQPSPDWQRFSKQLCQRVYDTSWKLQIRFLSEEKLAEVKSYPEYITKHLLHTPKADNSKGKQIIQLGFSDGNG